MPVKTKSRWDFNPDALTSPYVLIVVGLLVLSAVVGVISGDFKWGGLLLITAFIFGFFVNDSRPFLRRRQFWILTTLLLTLHLAVFVVVLLHVAVWRLTWFMVMLVELPVFFRMRDQLLVK